MNNSSTLLPVLFCVLEDKLGTALQQFMSQLTTKTKGKRHGTHVSNAVKNIWTTGCLFGKGNLETITRHWMNQWKAAKYTDNICKILSKQRHGLHSLLLLSCLSLLPWLGCKLWVSQLVTDWWTASIKHRWENSDVARVQVAAKAAIKGADLCFTLDIDTDTEPKLCSTEAHSHDTLCELG